MVSFNNLYVCLFLIYFISFKSDAYRILVIAPLNSRSHTNMLECVAKALAIKGHRVDMISHFELKNAPKNYTTIVNLDGTMPKFVNSWTKEMVDHYRDVDVVPTVVNDFGSNFCQLLAHDKMQKFIKNIPKDPPYDLVITEVCLLIYYNSRFQFIAICYFSSFNI